MTEMTREDIIRMAREADSYASKNYTQWVGPEVQNEEWIICRDERFAALIASRVATAAKAEEREAIAQIIEDAPPLVDYAINERGGCLVCGFAPKLASEFIRTRGETK